MGAWGPTAFENDDALDWMSELVEGSDLAPLVAALASVTDEVATGEDIDDSDGSNALAAAEVVAALRGRPAADLPEELSEWLSRQQAPDPHLVARARTAVKAVLGPHSDLRELWHESPDFAVWEANVKNLLARLG
jgi:hypothetical protein